MTHETTECPKDAARLLIAANGQAGLCGGCRKRRGDGPPTMVGKGNGSGREMEIRMDLR